MKSFLKLFVLTEMLILFNDARGMNFEENQSNNVSTRKTTIQWGEQSAETWSSAEINCGVDKIFLLTHKINFYRLFIGSPVDKSAEEINIDFPGKKEYSIQLAKFFKTADPLGDVSKNMFLTYLKVKCILDIVKHEEDDDESVEICGRMVFAKDWHDLFNVFQRLKNSYEDFFVGGNRRNMNDAFIKWLYRSYDATQEISYLRKTDPHASWLHFCIMHEQFLHKWAAPDLEFDPRDRLTAKQIFRLGTQTNGI